MPDSPTPHRTLVIFGAVALYGMERGVIETFALLRPEVEPHFLISQTPRRLRLPLFQEIEKHGFSHSFLSDKDGWERIGKPRSVRQLWEMIVGLVRGNIDAFRAVHHQEILYLPNLFAVYYAVLAMLFCRLKGRRVVYQFHDLIKSRSRSLRLLSLLITDFVHNTQLGYRESAEQNPYILQKRNFVIPCAVSARNELPQDLSMADEFSGKRNVLFVGQVSKPKGIEVLLQAFDIVASSQRDVRLHIAGGCQDPEIQQLVERLCERPDSQIKYWGYRNDVQNLTRFADVYVHPSLPSLFQESFGRGVVEAMAASLPTVCFRSGALQEVVTDGKTGLVCAEETVVCLADRLTQLLADANLRSRFGKLAGNRYRELYSDARVKVRWLKLFDENPATHNQVSFSARYS
jgi:glycosyltransferase involved in cell wall biosynthesis